MDILFLKLREMSIKELWQNTFFKVSFFLICKIKKLNMHTKFKSTFKNSTCSPPPSFTSEKNLKINEKSDASTALVALAKQRPGNISHIYFYIHWISKSQAT